MSPTATRPATSTSTSSSQLQQQQQQQHQQQTTTSLTTNSFIDANDDSDCSATFEISADPAKYVTLPIQNDDIWNKYQTTLDWFWTPHDIFLDNDKKFMEASLPIEKQEFIIKSLAILSTTHYCVITKDLFMAFMSQVEIKEASYFFGSQADTKKTHSRILSMLLDELNGYDLIKRDNLVSKVVSQPPVRHLISQAIQTITNESLYSFAQRLLAFTCLQGIVFPSILITIKFILSNKPNVAPGLMESTDYIWRDDTLHLNFACGLFRYIDDEVSEEQAYKIVDNYTNLTIELLTKSLSTLSIGIEQNLIEDYVKFKADYILSELNFTKLYHTDKNPFAWIQFETEPDSKKPKLKDQDTTLDVDEEDNFDLDNDF